MPNARTHDAVTFLLAVPTAAAVFAVTHSFAGAAAAFAAFLFGGLMFGPDLDTGSRQYSRWGIFRFFWYPYRSVFRHRSRWSHGLVFGTLIRVVYFLGIVTLASFAGAYLWATAVGGDLPRLAEVMAAWRPAGVWMRHHGGEYILETIFAGMWLGAASHTFTDMAGTYIKTGRVTEFL